MYRKTNRNIRRKGGGTSKLPTRKEGHRGSHFPRAAIKRAVVRATGESGIPEPRSTSRPRSGSRNRSGSKPRSATPKKRSPKKISQPKGRITSRVRTTTPKKKSPPRPRPPSRKRVGTASSKTQRHKTTARIDRLSAPKKRYSPKARAATPISKPTSARRKARYSPFAPSTPVSMQGPSLSQQRAISAERRKRRAFDKSSYGMMSGTGNYGS